MKLPITIDNDFEYNIYGLKRENPYEGSPYDRM